LNRILFVLAILMLPTMGFAQKKSSLKDRWRNSIGSSVHILHVRTSAIQRKGVTPAFGVYYNPQVNIINRYPDFSLAATMPISLGVHIKDSWIERTFFYGHVPAVLEANIGHYSTRDFRSNIGMGLGAGYAAQFTGSNVGTGFVATASARTWFFRGSLTIGYLFHYHVQGTGYNTHTIAVALNMGNYFKKLVHDNKMDKFQNFK
jgi:hypothetical protein